MKNFNKNVRYEKARRRFLEKAGILGRLMSEGVLYDHSNNMPIDWVCLTEDNELTFFSFSSSDYFTTISDLNEEDANAVLTFILNKF